MYQQLQYLKFLKNSSNQHGVHSPFVYQLLTQCFYDKTNYPAYRDLEAYRKALRNNTETLNITDFGSGSKKFKTDQRSISKMAKTAGTGLSRAKLLYRLVKYFKPQQILELGTSLGIATHAMALGNVHSQITTVEGCPQLAKFSKENLYGHGLKNITIGNTSFAEALSELQNKSFDFVFMDGHHTEQATLENFKRLRPMLHKDSILIFDDIHWSAEMTAAWNSIVADQEVTVSIDTFYWGLVTFRKEQPKEHFVIRV